MIINDVQNGQKEKKKKNAAEHPIFSSLVQKCFTFHLIASISSLPPPICVLLLSVWSGWRDHLSHTHTHTLVCPYQQSCILQCTIQIMYGFGHEVIYGLCRSVWIIIFNVYEMWDKTGIVGLELTLMCLDFDTNLCEYCILHVLSLFLFYSLALHFTLSPPPPRLPY